MALGTDLVGAEVDLLLPVTDETFRPITLHWEAGPRVIRVTMGKAMNAFPLHSDARVIPKFRHTHRTEFVGKGWTDEGQRLVNAAYDRLSKEERIYSRCPLCETEPAERKNEGTRSDKRQTISDDECSVHRE